MIWFIHSHSPFSVKSRDYSRDILAFSSDQVSTILGPDPHSSPRQKAGKFLESCPGDAFGGNGQPHVQTGLRPIDIPLLESRHHLQKIPFVLRDKLAFHIEKKEITASSDSDDGHSNVE
jgi:hypothetical protein